ncbi:transglutaminase family protein [Rubritalea spongiae]|uniref:Transglutaminase family protein n=1 Tax=Rubritalea spongiae TaxID=430797 RepID=A0ABW5E230_9BACT
MRSALNTEGVEVLFCLWQVYWVLRSDPKIIKPPCLLTGGAVLFWGVSTGNYFVALLLAFFLEAYRVVKVRWDFDENAHVKAFQFSILLMALWVALSWIEDEGRMGTLNVIRWLPLIAFPIEFVQRYGKLDKMNLNAFFYFSRRRMAIDRSEGKEVHPIQVNSGYPYLFAVLAAAGSEKENADYYWYVLCGFMLLALFSVLRQRGLSWGKALWLVPAVLLLSWGMQRTMSTTYAWAKARLDWGMLRSPSAGFMNDWHSHLSDLGDVHLSPKIEWRLWADAPPNYLKVASFNNYNGGRWDYDYKAGGFEHLDEAYLSSEPQIVAGKTGVDVTYFRPEDRELVRQGDALEVQIRGTVKHSQSSAVVPTVGGFYAITDILGPGVYAEVSPVGALRLVNRDMLIDYTLWFDKSYSELEAPPNEQIDLEIAADERLVIEELANELDLHNAESPEEVISRTVSYFMNNFEYATRFKNKGYDGARTKLDWFLNEVKKGHCEYYATAATLLLREAGIPARYCVGYAGVERGRDCWNVRGTNAHAWTSAYVHGKWVTVDATPSDWRGVSESAELDSVEWLREQISLMREDFFIWRQDPANTDKMVFRGSLVAGLLILWIVIRLWRNRSKSSEQVAYAKSWGGEVIRTPLLDLEKIAKKHVGARKRGEPYGLWLGQLAQLDGVDDDLVERAVLYHQSIRFDQGADQQELKEIVKELKKQLRKL